MPSSQTKIANAALKHLGSTTRLIEVHPESDNQHARDIADVWDSLRDFHLKRHNWNFAISRAELNRSDAPSFYDWTYRYQLPPECLRWLPWRRAHRYWIDGEVEGGYLYTHAETVVIRFIKRITNPALWSPEFVTVMEFAVADAIAESVTQSQSIKRDMADRLAAVMPTARRIDGLETGQRRRGGTVIRSDILSARGRSGTGIVRR